MKQSFDSFMVKALNNSFIEPCMDLSRILALQTSQNFLIQKMLQKPLKIFVIMPAFFDPGNGGKI